MHRSEILTFLYSDIEGSTRLWEAFPNEMPAALARHDVLLREAVEANSGQLVKTTGDGLLAVFANATSAVFAALAGQRSLAKESWGNTGPLKVRIGVHTGAAESRQGDYFGPAINRTARLMAVGSGGQVLLSQASEILVRDQLPDEIILRDLGEKRLKDLARPERIFQLVAPDLPDKFPALKTIEAYPNNLPYQLTSFIGREKEIDRIKRIFYPPDATNTSVQDQLTSRMVTLVGPGGTGKTRLSLQAGAEMLDHFIDGVWLVELAPLTDSALVAPSVATVLRLSQDSSDLPLSILIERLGKKHLLLILDNCEHLIEACSRLADNLLRYCPRLHLLATSREPLGIGGEIVLHVPSLSLPDREKPAAVEDLTQYESIRLFVERSQAIQPEFSLTEMNGPSIAQLCHRLDGIPLAIELAAARVNLLTVEQVNDRLIDRFRLLTGGSRVSLPRHQTLQALIDWSFDLLVESERILFRRLAIFSGGWTLEAAEHVCHGEGLGLGEILELLAGLVNKSLVVAEVDSLDHARYSYLETIQQYASSRLLDASEVERMRNRHLEFFTLLAEQGEMELYGPNQLQWFDLLEEDHDNFRAAMEWALESSQALFGLRIPGALHYFWYVRGYALEGVERSWNALQVFQDAEETLRIAIARAKVYSGAGFLYIWGLYDFDSGQRLLTQGLSLARELGDRRVMALGLDFLAFVLMARKENLEARGLLFEALELYNSIGDSNHAGRTQAFIGDTYFLERKPSEAQPYYEAGVDAFRLAGNTNYLTYATRRLGYVYLEMERPEQAKPLFAESLQLNVLLKEFQGIASCLAAFANVAFQQRDFSTAARLIGVAETLLTTHHTKLITLDAMLWDERIPEFRRLMGDNEFDKAQADGKSMTLETAIQLALAI